MSSTGNMTRSPKKNGRSAGPGRRPKYLFSRGFRRAQTLYGAREAACAAAEATGAFTLFVVEGVMDALRLQNLGRNAVALLGAQATTEQAALLGRILARAERARAKHVVLYLDPDEAGRTGAVATLRALIAVQREHGPFSLDVVDPPFREASAEKPDPDAALRGASREDAEKLLDTRKSALVALAAWYLGRRDEEGFDAQALSRLPSLERATAARRIADACDPGGLSLWLEPLAEADEQDPHAAFARRVLAYARPRSDAVRAPAAATLARPSDKAGMPPRPSDDADILRAIELAKSTAKRREYPVDEAAFLRLEIAGSALYHVHEARLKLGSGPAEPYPSRQVPKGGGRYRMKCGPVAEDIAQQQYLLSGLLRTHAGSPGVEAAIPAVRFADGERRLTGAFASPDDVPLSFAYQVDQAIADGAAPPRRAGLFRDYYKCWLDFIGFIDERLRRMRHGTVHVLRLDIAGYYDNLRRTDVRAALHGPILRATKEAGETLLPLVAPEEKDPAKRADAILNLLLDHSFGYAYRDPETGRVARASPDVGVPQGPDLSAYMANVALFELDAMMRREIEALDDAARRAAGGDETVVGATYARYVDDMVLVCGDRATLARLERRIAEHLAGMGLRLSPKNERLSPMTLRQARAWVTDNRSGAGFSGPLDDVVTRAFFDPLADAGDTPPDRKLALGLLGDPVLETRAAYEAGPSEARERVLRQLGTALDATEVRHNDRSRAYTFLWRLAVAGTPAAEREAVRVANTFVELVHDAEPRASSPEPHVLHDRAMAALDGLELVLRRERASDVATTEDERRQLDLRDALAALDVPALTAAAVRGLHAPLSGKSAAAAAARFLARYDVTMQRATSVVAACGHAPDGAERNLDSIREALEDARTDWPGSIAASLRRFGKQVPRESVEGLRVDLRRDAVAWRLLHADIAEWQRWADPRVIGERTEPDFVSPEPRGEAAGDGLLEIVAAIRRVWAVRPDPTSHPAMPEASKASVAAASALLNIALARAGALLLGRKDMVALLLDNGGGAEPVEVFLPTPPTLKTAEALLVRGSKIIHVAVGDAPGEPNVFGLTFEMPETVAEHLIRRDAKLTGFTKLIDRLGLEGAPYLHERPGDVAKAYRALLPKFLKAQGDREAAVLLPSAHSFFLREVDGRVEHHVVAWTCPPEQADDFASVRDGGALVPEPIFQEGAPYWRFGWALVDAFEYARSVPNPARLRKGDAEPEREAADDLHETEAQLADALVRNACTRLTGTDMFGPGQPDEHGVPSRIARGLRLFEAFEEARGENWTDRGRARAATIALATYADGVMVKERIERPGEPHRPGGPAALLARAARRGGRGVPQARTHWGDEEAPALPPLRRDAGAWFALADRVAARAAEAAEAAVATKEPCTLLAPLVAGMRILGLTRGLRGLVHDLVRMGGEPTKAALANLPLDIPALAARIGEDAALIERPDPTASRGETSSHDLAKELRSTLQRVEASLTAGGHGQVSDVTPLGWAVVAAGLAQAAPLVGESLLAERPALAQPSDATAITSAFDALFAVLCQRGTAAPREAPGVRTDPREALEAYRDVGLAAWNAARDALVTIDALLGIEVEPLKLDQEPLRRNVSRSGAFELRLPDGSIRHLPEHAIARDVLKSRDRSAARITARVVGEDDRLSFPATLTRIGERALAVALVSDSFALCAFGAGREPLTALAPAEVPGDVDAARAGQAQAEGEERSFTPPIAPPEMTVGSAETLEDAPEEEEEPQPGGGGSGAPPDEGGAVAADESGKPRKGGGGAELDAALAKIHETQRESWRARAPRSPRMRRIALLQWDVAETYSFPGNDPDRYFPRIKEGETPPLREEADGPQSLEEMRRRAILERVIEACEAFQVEGLVIPEYTMRPETVNWLYRRLQSDGPPMDFPRAVWAGTFRVPGGHSCRIGVDGVGQPVPGEAADTVFQLIPTPEEKEKQMQASEVDEPTRSGSGSALIQPFSSVLPLLHRVPPDVQRGHDMGTAGRFALSYRLKRHPSLAFQEEIRPDTPDWRPLGDDYWGHMHLLSFTAELICAEMFLHASTSNLFAVKLALEDLRLRFGLPLRSTDKNGASRSVLDELVTEIFTYCEATAFSMRTPNFPPVLSPNADLLQRSILVIPATTGRSADYHVFGQAQHLAAGLVTVFANHSRYPACGGSAFIGLDGWKSIDQKVTIYGEIGPGLFHYQKADFGALGERECALVIADVDPLHTTDQKPRPQYQPRPLQLVAHLPLIFETEACNDARYTKKTPGGDEKPETPPLRHENDGIAAGRRSPRDHPDGKRVVRRRDLPWDHAPPKNVAYTTQDAHTFAEAIAATWNAARAAAVARRYRDRDLDRCLRVLTRFADDPHWLDKRREQLTKSPIVHPPGDPPPALVDWIYVADGFDRATPSAEPDDPEPR